MLLSYFLAFLFLALFLEITRQPVRTYTGQGLQPCIYPELARTDAVKLATGTYAAGTVIGQMSTLTAANDVQTITVTGTPTGGTFRLLFNGVETANITFSETAATLAANITAALEALPQIGSGNVTTSASVTVPAVTFQGALAAQWQPLMTVSVNGLTGGTSPAATIAHTTPGRSAGSMWRAYDDGQSDGTNIAKAVLQYPYTVTPDGRHYNGTDASGKYDLNASAYIRGFFRTADLTGLDAAGVADLGRIVEGAIGSLTSTATILGIGE